MQTDSSRDSAAKHPAPIELLAIALWSIAVAVVLIRVCVAQHVHSVFPTYRNAGANWIAARPLYLLDGEKFLLFPYSPLTAAFFSPFSLLPDFAGEIFWRLLTTASFLGGIVWWLRTGVQQQSAQKDRALFFILLLPLAVGNLNNGQMNFPLAALLVCAFAAANNARWSLAALLIAAAAYLKVYPLVIGLLLALIHPRKFTWRFLLALAGLGALTFLLQKPGYVLDQYRMWISTRLSENRHRLPGGNMLRDLWLLFNVLHCGIGERGYMAVQFFSGAGVAAACLCGRIRKWPGDRLLLTLFSLGTTWMILCGPATESATYVLLVPFVILALLHEWREPGAPWMLVSIITIFAVFLTGQAINSFTHHREPEWMAVEPAGALLFFFYLLAQAFRQPSAPMEPENAQ